VNLKNSTAGLFSSLILLQSIYVHAFSTYTYDMRIQITALEMDGSMEG